MTYGCGNNACVPCYPFTYRCDHGIDYPEPIPNGEPIPECPDEHEDDEDEAPWWVRDLTRAHALLETAHERLEVIAGTDVSQDCIHKALLILDDVIVAHDC